MFRFFVLSFFALVLSSCNVDLPSPVALNEDLRLRICQRPVVVNTEDNRIDYILLKRGEKPVCTGGSCSFLAALQTAAACSSFGAQVVEVPNGMVINFGDVYQPDPGSTAFIAGNIPGDLTVRTTDVPGASAFLQISRDVVGFNFLRASGMLKLQNISLSGGQRATLLEASHVGLEASELRGSRQSVLVSAPLSTWSDVQVRGNSGVSRFNTKEMQALGPVLFKDNAHIDLTPSDDLSMSSLGGAWRFDETDKISLTVPEGAKVSLEKFEVEQAQAVEFVSHSEFGGSKLEIEDFDFNRVGRFDLTGSGFDSGFAMRRGQVNRVQETMIRWVASDAQQTNVIDRVSFMNGDQFELAGGEISEAQFIISNATIGRHNDVKFNLVGHEVDDPEFVSPSGLTLQFVTFAENKSVQFFASGPAGISLGNNLFYGAGGRIDCRADFDFSGQVAATILVGPFNIGPASSSCNFPVTGAANVILMSDGRSYRPDPSSAAYGVVPSSRCSLPVDQNGAPRPQGGACEAGSIEQP